MTESAESKDREHRIREEIFRRAFMEEETSRLAGFRAANDQAISEILRQNTDLSPEQIEQTISSVRSEYRRQETGKPFGKRLAALLFVFAAALIVTVLGFLWGGKQDHVTGKEQTEPAISSRKPPFNASSPNEAVRKDAVKNVEDSMPAYGRTYHREALKRAVPIRVSIRENKFKPVDMMMPASWNEATPVSGEKPEDIVREPDYQGVGRRYGCLNLGTSENNRYCFAFDLIRGPNPVLYFDFNQNGDLSDDGPPLVNQGTGIFATMISIPMQRMMPQSRYAGDFLMWFFTNESLWERSHVGHYSRTQLQGFVDIEGRRLMAWIADGRNNDADFTNDGIYVDLDDNGKIDDKTERFPPDEVALIFDKEYRFIVSW